MWTEEDQETRLWQQEEQHSGSYKRTPYLRTREYLITLFLQSDADQLQEGGMTTGTPSLHSTL